MFLGENVIPIAKMQSSVVTNLHFFSILFYNKSQKWKILETLGLFWCMHSGYNAGCIEKCVDSSLVQTAVKCIFAKTGGMMGKKLEGHTK